MSGRRVGVGSRAVIDHSRRAVGFVTGMAAVALVACSAGTANGPVSGTRQPLTPAPASTAVVPVADRAEQEALAAYRGMWQDFAVAGITSDWRSPALGRYATGVALTNLSRGLYADHYNGLVTKGEPILHPRVLSVDPPQDPTRVVITDCGDSTHWLKYRTNSGRLVNDKPGGRSLINAIVDKQPDGSWKVSDYGVHEIGTC
jgi:hypothetical protein